MLSAAAGAQVLTFVDGWREGIGGIDGIRGNRGVVVTEDGRYVYAGGETDNGLTVFSRDRDTGELTQIQVLKNGIGGIDGLGGANVVRLSPGEDNVYVSGFFQDSLAVFARDKHTGLLTEIQVLKDGVGGIDGLNGALWIAVSQNGKNLYLTGFFDNAVVVFDRDKQDGTLTLHQLLRAGVGGITGIRGAYSMFMDKEDKFVYVGGLQDNAIVVFSRSKSNGELSQVQMLQDGVGGIDGLAAVRGLIGDRHDDNLYSVAIADNAISSFAIDKHDGTLTQLQVVKDTDVGIDGLKGATGINIDPDGRFVYAAAFSEGRLSVWERSSSTGLLTLSQVLINGIATPCCQIGPIDIYPTRDGCQIYTANYSTSSILLFDVVDCHHDEDDD
ncbi:MAG TPA: beta-propeller fold lactonase family protein [Thermoanaerobaculia bacterium]|nr:beta-propeller fold lactonase family protein [Thermoanaerobaculia bacterium]